ncbi:MAG: hypothetical protein Q7T96_00795 [Methylobacter sp.]|nr:hypothetical protein [Methylobacter sp.]
MKDLTLSISKHRFPEKMGSGWRWNSGKNEGGDWKIAFSVRHYLAGL